MSCVDKCTCLCRKKVGSRVGEHASAWSIVLDSGGNCRESLRKCYVHNSSFLSCSIHPLSLRLHVTCIVGHFKPFKLSKNNRGRASTLCFSWGCLCRRRFCLCLGRRRLCLCLCRRSLCLCREASALLVSPLQAPLRLCRCCLRPSRRRPPLQMLPPPLPAQLERQPPGLTLCSCSSRFGSLGLAAGAASAAFACSARYASTSCGPACRERSSAVCTD